MPRFTKPHFSALNRYSHISLMFSAGLMVLVVVLLVVAYDEVRDRIKKFARAFVTLLSIRKSLVPKVKVNHFNEAAGREISHVFDL